MSSWIAAATSYSVSDTPMIPFYVYYSMFGFQRIGDLAWAAGDSRARGFLMGGTAGRTTLNGEGLQHEDGHSHLISATIPNCVSYDPTYAHEVAVIVQDGLRRMFTEQEDVFYYLTLMNENYEHPGLPGEADRRDEVIEGIKRGMYLLRTTGEAGGAQGWPPRAAPGQRHDPARGRGGRRAAGRRARCRRGRLELPQLHRARPRRPSPRTGGTCCTPASSGAPAGSPRSWPGARPARSSPRPTTCAPSPSRSARRCPPTGATSCSARTASAAPTTAGACARHFEVDRHHVVLAALSALAAEGAVPRARSPTPSPATTSTPTSSTPPAPERTTARPHVLDRSERKTHAHRGPGPRHRRLQRRADHRGARRARVTRSTPRTRC